MAATAIPLIQYICAYTTIPLYQVIYLRNRIYLILYCVVHEYRYVWHTMIARNAITKKNLLQTRVIKNSHATNKIVEDIPVCKVANAVLMSIFNTDKKVVLLNEPAGLSWLIRNAYVSGNWFVIPRSPLGISPAKLPPVTVSKTRLAFSGNPPIAIPANLSSGAYCTASSAAHSLVSAPPLYPHIVYRVLVAKRNSVVEASTARMESRVA